MRYNDKVQVIIRDTKRFLRKQEKHRNRTSKSDIHIYTKLYRTQEKGKLERQTFSLVQQIFIDAKTFPRGWQMRNSVVRL